MRCHWLTSAAVLLVVLDLHWLQPSIASPCPLLASVHCTCWHSLHLTDAYDWCIVPNSSYDVVLFAGLSVVLASLVNGKHATLVILLAGVRGSKLNLPYQQQCNS